MDNSLAMAQKISQEMKLLFSIEDDKLTFKNQYDDIMQVEPMMLDVQGLDWLREELEALVV